MSGDLLTDLDFAPERETVREPHKLWRNRYRALKPGVYGRTGSLSLREAGEVWWGRRVWPSKEAAEAGAHTPESSVTRGGADYLGAFPVDENGKPL